MNTVNDVDVKELLIKADGLLHGHFCLTSGLHSDTYFQCAKLYQYPDIVEIIGKKLAEKLSNIEYDTIIAPAIGAIIFGYEVAKQAKKRNLFVERKDDIMQLRRGYTLKKGERVVIIEDVINCVKQGRTPLVLSKYVDHAHKLYERLAGHASRVFLLTGANSKKNNDVKK